MALGKTVNTSTETSRKFVFRHVQHTRFFSQASRNGIRAKHTHSSRASLTQTPLSLKLISGCIVPCCAMTRTMPPDNDRRRCNHRYARSECVLVYSRQQWRRFTRSSALRPKHHSESNICIPLEPVTSVFPQMERVESPGCTFIFNFYIYHSTAVAGLSR
jgi:hypothetical protein